ncbi:MAG: arabinofuranosidase catalytic domain-containing protein [Anaerolineales bacterium]
MKLNFKSWKNKAIILVIGLALLVSLGGAGLKASAAGTGPCDIYGAAGNTCVAAYSTVRALYGAYSGSLYQVRRSDGATQDIGVLSTGGYANAAAQDTFCSGKTCTISIIYDQSGKGNHLTKAPGGSATYGPNPDVEAVADALPITIAGHKAYGVHVVGSSSWTATGQVGYRNTNTNGIAKGDNPETEYMVTDGTYYNGSCCFDFGNAEMQPVAGGYGTMEAVYFGNNTWWDKGAGNGPWVMADLEVGVFNSGNANGSWVTNNNDISFTYPFVTAYLKGNSASGSGGGPFTLKGGNAQSGSLITVYDGAFPPSYSPMHRQGGVVLGVGGDNSSMAHGNFYEGVMTTGYASTATDNAVQANIVAAGYGSGTISPTATPTRTTSPNAPTATRTRTPTPGASLTPGGPTPTRTNTPTPGSGSCSPVSSTITAPFTYDVAGTFCWQSSNLGSYITSWNLTSLTVNGVNETNLYVASGSYPAKINGYWYVSYSSAVSYGHFEAK